MCLLFLLSLIFDILSFLCAPSVKYHPLPPPPYTRSFVHQLRQHGLTSDE